jgi:hypothetical protein
LTLVFGRAKVGETMIILKPEDDNFLNNSGITVVKTGFVHFFNKNVEK